MKHSARIILGSFLLAGAATIAAAPAEARGIAFDFGVGIPGPVMAPPPAYFGPPAYYGPCDYYSYYYGGCRYPAGYISYADPIFIDGSWAAGPHYYRTYQGRPEVWFGGRWRADFRRR